MLFLLAFCLQPQSVDVQKPEAPPPAALERIRRALEGPALDSVVDREGPVFRVYIREHPLPPQRLWTDETLRSLYVQPQFPINHHEFLETVTPEEFRAATLYPIGVDAIAVVDGAIKVIRKAMRARSEANARRMVQEELRLLLEARKKENKDR